MIIYRKIITLNQSSKRDMELLLGTSYKEQ